MTIAVVCGWTAVGDTKAGGQIPGWCQMGNSLQLRGSAAELTDFSSIVFLPFCLIQWVTVVSFWGVFGWLDFCWYLTSYMCFVTPAHLEDTDDFLFVSPEEVMLLRGCEQAVLVPVICQQKLLAKLWLKPLLLPDQAKCLCFLRSSGEKEVRSRVEEILEDSLSWLQFLALLCYSCR